MMEIRQTTTYEKWFETLKDRNARMRCKWQVLFPVNAEVVFPCFGEKTQ